MDNYYKSHCIALDWKMINHSTLEYHVTNFNLYAGRNLYQNHNHDLNLYTIHRIAASALGLAAVQPLDRVLAQPKFFIILHANKLALQTTSNLVRKISLLARTLGLKAGQARTVRDDKVCYIQIPPITHILAKLL